MAGNVRRFGVRIADLDAKGKKKAEVRFGSVLLRAAKPSPAEVRHNVEASTSALERAKKRLAKGGVRLYPKKGVPLFYADPDHPGTFVRLLDGRRERGILENGEFKVSA